MSEEWKLAAQNEKLRLYYNENRAEIRVENKETGYIWDSALGQEQFPEDVTEVQKEEMTSLLSITYSNASTLSSTTSQTSLESTEYSLEMKKSKDGFLYHIYIEELDIRISVLFQLDEYGLQVSIPEDGLEETVKSEELVRGYCATIELLTEKMTERFEELRQEKLTDSLEKKLNQSMKKIEDMQNILDETSTPFGISVQCEELLDDVDSIDTAMRGSSKSEGFYTSLLKSDELSNEKKDQYRSDMTTMESEILNLNIQIAQMQAISAATMVSINLMPYFGAQTDESEGYMLYPDGCGALTRFKENHGSFSSCYQTTAYSSMSPDIDWELEKDSLGIDNQAIPYFGIQTGNDACIAYVAQGQAQSMITFEPSGYILSVNRIGAGFTYRQTVATSASNGEWQSSEDTMIFQEDKENYTATVEYMFLANDLADYSGMANALRDYFQKQGILKQSELVQGGQMPLALDLFGGYKSSVLIFEQYITGTTIQDADTILDAFSDIPVLCNYSGLYEEGYGVYPTQYEISDKLGDVEELAKIADKLQSMGGQLFMEAGRILADYDQSGYSDGDLTIGNNYQVLQNKDKTKYLFSPELIQTENEENILKKISKYRNTGITETMLGAFVYADFSVKHYSSRIQTVKYWKKILETDIENAGFVAVDSGSDYTFASADWLRNIPDDVSGYIYTDEAVPFYSMIVHGSVACTADPNNEFYNSETQMLKAIEYGFLPYFSVTSEKINLSSTGVYASQFSAIYKNIVESYNDYAELMGNLTDVAMTHHDRVGNLTVVEYENGEKILLNYGDEDVVYEGIQVSAKSAAKIGEQEVKKLEEKDVKIEEKGEQSGISVYSSMVVWLSVILFISIVIFGGISFFYRHKS
jgi:hypothetical protein